MLPSTIAGIVQAKDHQQPQKNRMSVTTMAKMKADWSFLVTCTVVGTVVGWELTTTTLLLLCCWAICRTFSCNIFSLKFTHWLRCSKHWLLLLRRVCRWLVWWWICTCSKNYLFCWFPFEYYKCSLEVVLACVHACMLISQPAGTPGPIGCFVGS